MTGFSAPVERGVHTADDRRFLAAFEECTLPTVTVAFVRIVSSRIVRGESWLGFSSRISEVLNGKSPILLQYYSPQRLFSEEARLHFAEPDLGRLPELDD